MTIGQDVGNTGRASENPLTNPSLPTPKQLFLDVSLYAPYPFEQLVGEDILALRNGNYQFDGYCDRCQTSSIFKGGRSVHQLAGTAVAEFLIKTLYFTTVASCARCGRSYRLELLKTSANVQKIGQYPSMEDIGSADIIRFRKLLKKDDFAELRRASGLFSHGIGIGSFVYLRRIFERMIEQHWAEAVNAGHQLEALTGKRMDEKIKLLADFLPSMLVKNASVYGILSKGIHELDEATCRLYFPVVRAAIVAILEQDLREQEEAASTLALQKDIERISRELKGNP